MCDYSLHGVATRPAKVGDKLVTTQFWNTNTRGFSAASESRVAVCLIPGTEVVFERDAKRALTGFQIFFRKAANTGHKVARFRQVNMDNPCAHHDASSFRMAKSCCLRTSAQDNAQPYCSYQTSRSP